MGVCLKGRLWPDSAAVVRPGRAWLRVAACLAVLVGLSGCGWFPGLGRTEPDASLRLATVFLGAGAPEPALRAVDDALTRRPRDVEALTLRGDALAALGRGEEAQQAYMAAIAEAPRSVAPRIALGRMLVRGNPAAAEAVFNEVLARQPGNAVALNNLGIARDLQGRHREAQAAYRGARVADPAMSGAGVNLGLSLVLSGDMAEAVQVLAPLAAAQDAPATVVENLGIALAASGRPEEAAQVLGRVMAPGAVAETLAQYRGAPAVPGSARVAAAAVPPATTALVAAVPAAPVAAAPVAAAPVAARPTAAPAAAASPVVEAQVVAAPVDSAPVAAAPIAPAPISPAPVASEGPEPIAAVAAAPDAEVGGAQVYAQLAATDSERGAPAEWRRLRRLIPDLLRDRPELVVPAEVAGRSVWRLRTGPFRHLAEAQAFCGTVRAAGRGCWVAAGG